MGMGFSNPNSLTPFTSSGLIPIASKVVILLPQNKNIKKAQPG
jgi:hypothetical protein